MVCCYALTQNRLAEWILTQLYSSWRDGQRLIRGADLVRTGDPLPYGHGVYHLNSISQPSAATDVSVAGIAICTESVVPGCGTGARHEVDIALTAKITVKVAKEFGRGTCQFYNGAKQAQVLALYSSLSHLRTRKA